MVHVPTDTPPTTPVVTSTVPTAGLELLQVPPPVGLVNVDVLPTHTTVLPLIAAGEVTTVTTVVV
jgi:hypothetical protein